MNNITGRTLDLNSFPEHAKLCVVLIATLAVGIVAGSYPALVLSSFSPSTVLKGAGKSGKIGVSLRKKDLLFSNSVSPSRSSLETMVVYFQMNHILNKNLGFDKERMLIVDLQLRQ